MIDIRLIEARLSELSKKAEGMNTEDEEHLFQTEIAPLVRLQRIYLRETGRIPPLNDRYNKWKQKERIDLEKVMDTVVEKQKERKENMEEGY